MPAGEDLRGGHLHEILKLAYCPTWSLLPSRLYLLCRRSHELHCISVAPAALDRYLGGPAAAGSLIPFAPLLVTNGRKPWQLRFTSDVALDLSTHCS